MPWLTGDEIPEDEFCRVIRVPNDPAFIHAVSGALLDLTYAHNWEQLGALTPQEQADAFDNVYVAFMNSEGCADITPIYPTSFFSPGYFARKLTGTTLSHSVVAGQQMNLLTTVTPIANGNSLELDFFCAKGQYEIWQVTALAPSWGIVDRYIDGVFLNSLSHYQAGTLLNQIMNISNGYDILTDGKHTMKFTVNGKAGTSSNYQFGLTALFGQKVADLP